MITPKTPENIYSKIVNKDISKYDDAIESYLYSLKIDKSNRYVWKDLASIYRDKGDFMKAIEADEKALELNISLEDNSD